MSQETLFPKGDPDNELPLLECPVCADPLKWARRFKDRALTVACYHCDLKWLIEGSAGP